MTFCKHCGSQIEDNAAFCGVCGQAQNAAEPQTPVYQAPQAPVQPFYVAPQAPVYAQPPIQPVAKPVIPGKGLGIASMVLGIVSLAIFCAWYLAIPCAIIGAALGGVAQSKAKAAGVKNGMAVAGIACSCVSLGISVLVLLWTVIEGISFYDYYF